MSEQLTELTLFPRVSKTSKANFGYRLTIFREHFFKHRFFKDDKLVILTLMKGDEVVEMIKYIARLAALFFDSRHNAKKRIHELIDTNAAASANLMSHRR